MKGMTNGKPQRARRSACFVLALALVGVVLEGQGQIYNLNNGNSSVTVDASAGILNYQVNGLPQMSSQWFWYRLGNVGPERPINTVGPLTPVQSDARTLDLSYASLQYSARVVYTLTGGSIGSGSSSLTEAITFLNTSTSTLDLHFFDYTDFDLLGGGAGQTIQFGTTTIPVPRINKFTQTLGPVTATVSLTAGLYNPSAAEAALFNQTLASLNDGGPTTLNNNLGPLAGDVTGAFQWDVSLAAGNSLTISQIVSLASVPVPEPSVLALFALGLLGALYRKNRFQ
jgi:large repetitive protein